MEKIEKAEVHEKPGMVRRVVTSVELPFFFYVFGLMMHMPILQQYSYLRFSMIENFPYHFKAHDNSCGKDTLNGTLKVLQQKVQAETAHFQIAQSLCSTVPSLIVCLIYGSWSDQVGRKPLVIIGMIGGFIDSICVFLTMVLNLPLWFVLVGNFFNGLGGYFTGLILAVMAYVADTASKEDRALRLGILEAVIFFGSMISNFLSGHFISSFGFTKSYITVLCCLLIACFCSIFFLEESLKGRNHEVFNSLFSKKCLAYPLQVWNVLTKPRPNKWKIAIMFPATLCINMLSMGIGAVITLYILNSPLCLPPVEVGYFSGTRFLSLGLGAAIGIKVLRMFLPMHIIALIGIFSYGGFYTILAFAKTKAVTYIAISAGCLAGTAGPIFRSILSGTVGQSEQGALFSAVSSLEMLVVFLGSLIFNAVYPILNDHGHPGAIFYLTDLMLLLPLLFCLIYTFKVKNISEDVKSIIEDNIANPGDGVKVGYGSNGSSPPISPDA